MSDASIMGQKIDQLVEMANKVNDIVHGVGQIAEQIIYWLLTLPSSSPSRKNRQVLQLWPMKFANGTYKSLKG